MWTNAQSTHNPRAGFLHGRLNAAARPRTIPTNIAKTNSGIEFLLFRTALLESGIFHSAASHAVTSDLAFHSSNVRSSSQPEGVANHFGQDLSAYSVIFCA